MQNKKPQPENDAFVCAFKEKYHHTSSFSSGIAILLADFFGIMLCIAGAFFVINAIDKHLITFIAFVEYAVYFPFFFLVYYAAHLYPGITLAPSDEIRRLTVCSMCCFCGIALSITVENDERNALIAAFLAAVPLSVFIMPAMREFMRYICSHFSWWGVPCTVYCCGAEGYTIVDRLLLHAEYGYHPALILDIECDKSADEDNPHFYKNIPVFFPGEAIITQALKTGMTTAIIAEDPNGVLQKLDIVSNTMNLYRYMVTVPYRNTFSTAYLSVRDFGGILAFASTHNLRRTHNLAIKRAIDLLLIIASLPLTAPLTLFIACGIKLSSKGPVFFAHERVGKNGKIIKTWKFRSMCFDAAERLAELLRTDEKAREEWAKNQKLSHDPRITSFGRFLRKTSLDELPQFWNIFIGQMSFAGPRPVTPSELEKYGKHKDFLLSVKPGLSGFWQISGRSETGYEKRIMLDLYYIQNWSVWLDVWIILKTFGVVFKGKGAY